MNADVLATIVRTSRTGPLVCSAALSVLVLLVPIVLGAELDFLDATLTLHLAMVAMLIGTAFVLDDPAQPLTEVLPYSARYVRAVRMALTLVPVTACWAVLLLLAPMTVTSAAAFPRAGLVVEPYALLAWTWACAVFAAARRGGRGSTLAAPALLVLSVVPALLPDPVAFYVSPGAPTYEESRLRWAVLLVLGLIALLAVVARWRPVAARRAR